MQNATTLSFKQVLGEAIQEVNDLEEKNCKMQDVLNELQIGILNLNNSMFSMNIVDSKSDEKSVTDASFADQFKEFKNLSSDITSKLNLMIKDNTKDGLLQDAFQSGLSEIKKKLSSLSMVVQQLSQSGKEEELVVSTAPSLCVPADESYLNSTSILDNSNDLQYQLKDALDKNVKWQNYNQEREQYVSLLLSKYNQNCIELKKIREKLTEITSQPDKLAVEQRRYFDKLLVDARQELENQRSENLQVVTELNVLRNKYKEEATQSDSNVERWRKQYEEQREALAVMHAHYENEKRRSNSNEIENKEKQSQIQLLQRQVQLFSEDFRAERKEKEIAQNEIDFLKGKVIKLQQEIEKQKKPPVSLKSSSISEQVKSNNEYNSKNFKKIAKSFKNIPIDVASKAGDNFSHLNDQSITTRRCSPLPKPRLHKPERKIKLNDSPSQLKSLSHRTDRGKLADNAKMPRNQLSDGDSMLHCPICDQQYSFEEHMMLLEHIDVCGD